MATTQQQRERLVNLLKELFQLDQPDLDFGFWRIMHAKSKQVTEFLDKDLLAVIEGAFGRQDAARRADLEQACQMEVRKATEYGAPDPEAVPAVRKVREALAAYGNRSNVEVEVYDHLYRFFERYYEGGDFLARRYYSAETEGKAAAYAIPYDGREVHLHWANADQYYIKTSEYFTNFSFDPTKAAEVKDQPDLFTGQALNESMRVHYRVVAATEGEHGNVKATEEQKRFFLLHQVEPVAFENGELIIRFEYRPDPEKGGQEGKWQATRNEQAVRGVFEALERHADPKAARYAAVLRAAAPTDKQRDRPLLAKYLGQYTSRNTMDYFIHKDLGGFLRRELDFYIKNEIMRLDDLDRADAPRAEAYLDKVRVLRQIARQIIDFLAQLEDFQKKLWLKKKFVVETNWCITIDRFIAIEDEKVREGLLREIAANDSQREEWVRLFAIDEIKGDLAVVGYSVPLKVEFLMEMPTLVVDSRNFSEDFRVRLLGVIGDIDEQTDGVMVHSENFQALSILSVRLRGEVRCIYIDPPYNVPGSEILYKNEFLHSSWLALLQDRLVRGLPMLSSEGITCVTIDDYEKHRLLSLIEAIAGSDSILGVVCIRNNPSGRATVKGFAVNHEYAVFLSNGIGGSGLGRFEHSEEQRARYDLKDEKGHPYELENMRKSSAGSLRKDRRKQYFALFVNGSSLRIRLPKQVWDVVLKKWDLQEKPLIGEEVVYPVSEDGLERCWSVGLERVGRELVTLVAELSRGRVEVYKRKFLNLGGILPRTWWDKVEYSARDSGTRVLRDMLGRSQPFDFPKAITAVEDCLRVCGLEDGDTSLDYFGGSGTSGHAVINLNREDGGRRRFVLVEMGDHFETVLVPRIKKATFTPEWRDGKPERPASAEEVERSPRIMKVLRLESYEDCLNNLAFSADAAREKALAANPGLRRDYMLKYMLDVETRGSVSLLNIDRFAEPTAYTLKVKKPGTDEYVEKSVDLIETFNYLLGLRVEHMAAPETLTAKFVRPKDAELPDDHHTRLVIDGKLKRDAKGAWRFRRIEGWVPKNLSTPNDGQREKVLIIWRKLTGDLEQDNAVLDAFCMGLGINTLDFEYDTIYVNGSNNLPNLKRDEDRWKVRMIEEDFHRLMWDVEDV